MSFRFTTMLKAFGCGVAVVYASGITAASAQSGTHDFPERIKNAGKIIVGIETTYPPMGYKDPATNERVGFNVDLVNSFAKEIQLEVEWQEMSFEQLMTSLTSKRIDMIGTAISDYPSRREKLTFVDYLRTGSQPFTLAAKSGDIKSETDLCGKKVGAPRTTNYYPITQKWSDAHCVAAGKPAMTVNGTAGATATRLDLKQGRLDAAVLGPEYVAYLMKDEPGVYALAGNTLTEGLFGLAFDKQDLGLRDGVAEAVQRLITNGTYEQILKKYGLERQAVAEVAIDAGQ